MGSTDEQTYSALKNDVEEQSEWLPDRERLQYQCLRCKHHQNPFLRRCSPLQRGLCLALLCALLFAGLVLCFLGISSRTLSQSVGITGLLICIAGLILSCVVLTECLTASVKHRSVAATSYGMEHFIRDHQLVAHLTDDPNTEE